MATETKIVNRYGQVPDKWTIQSLGEVSANYDSKRRPLSKMLRRRRQGGYPYYGAAKIIDYIDDYIFDGEYCLIAEDGSVITSARNPMMQLVKGRFWANNHTHILQGKEPISTKYLYYYLCGFDISGYITGVAQPKINQDNLNRIPILVPPKDIIYKITSILSTYDDLIENNNRRIKILKKMAQSIYNEWFVKFRFPGCKKSKMVNSEIGKIPEGWMVQTVKNAVKRLKANKVWTNNKVLPEGQVPVIDQSQSEFLGFHNEKPAHIASPENPIIIFGDHTCKMQIMVEPFSLGPNVIPFIGQEGYEIAYLFFTVRHLVETREYKRHWNELIVKKIVVSKQDVQSAYSDVVTPMLEEIDILNKKNNKMGQMRNILLTKLISGELNVEDLDIKVDN